MARPACKFSANELRNWKLLEHFRTALLPRLAALPTLATEKDSRRKLTREDYFCLFLFSMLNPMIRSMRGLCAASRCQKMREVSAQPVTPASFSAAQHLFSPEVLEDIVRDLAAQATGMVDFGDRQVRQALQTLTIRDGTVLRAVNRMTWAPAAGFGSAVRLHLDFSAFDQVPVDWSITPGNVSELKEWKKKVKPGSFVVADRLYSEDHLHLKQLKKRGVHFVLRLLGNVTRTAQAASRELSQEDRAAGIVSDQLVELGCRGGGPVLRVIEVHAEGKVLLLATTREDLPAAVIGLIYRYRWQIELFFRWFKTMLPTRHWLAESPQGVAIQIYCAMIASLLLLIWTGKRPSKRQMEALWFYWVGFFSEEELIQAFQKNS
ncbi:MAG TPA: IS4 family transposase [Candidatus Saccharimonadales bacterium]|nr:IS4 family transposase [Candidatus Saccharimonadales bacterium]